MNKCDSCASDRVFKVGGKSSDCNSWTYKGREGNGYLPDVKNVCGGDYYDFSVCLNCGKIQGRFPVESEELERDVAAEALQCFLDNYDNHEGKLYLVGKVDPPSLTDRFGFRFGHAKTQHDRNRWCREMYCFFFGSPMAYTYVFVDPERDMVIRTMTHTQMPADHYGVEEISR